MTAIRVFTVYPQQDKKSDKGDIKPGARVQACVSASGEPASAILVGRDEDEPRFLPINGLWPHNQEDEEAPVEIQMVEVDTTTLELAACSSKAKADSEYVLVTFSVRSEEEAYYQVCSKAESQCGINAHLKPLKHDEHPSSPSRVQFVQLLKGGDPLTVHLRDAEGLHVETYCWSEDESRLSRLGRLTVKL